MSCEKQKKKKKKRGVPDRWLDYRPLGRRIPGTRFIAFKVPLKRSLNALVPLADSFGPWQLLDSVRGQDQDLGLIIDLTFTARYYHLSDVPQSCRYLKIPTQGHRVPSDAAVLSFKRAVTDFLNQNQDNDMLIGVHCTHGLNRTGYLVCRYLIDVAEVEPAAAVELFNTCRGHRIERQNYLLDLLQGPPRSNAGIQEPEQQPIRGLSEAPPPDPTHRPPPSPDPAHISPPGPAPSETPDPSDETQTPAENRPHSNRRHRGARHRRGNKPKQSGLLPTPPLPVYQWSPAPS